MNGTQYSQVADQLRREILGGHYESQRVWLDRTQGMDSYLNTMQDLARDVGLLSTRYPYAEGFRRHIHYGYCHTDADPLRAALPNHTCPKH